MKVQNLLTPSIEKRALELIIEKNMDIIEAVKQALIDETNFIGSLFNGGELSERGKLASSKLQQDYLSKTK